MATIGLNIQHVLDRIAAACAKVQREVSGVRLLAVSKTFDAAAVREAHACGLSAFGENYPQEALAKMDALADLRDRLEWHFIGHLQSNKTREVAARFDWVHTVDRLKIAQRLSDQRIEAGVTTPLNVCIQVNISGEATKSGAAPHEVVALARAVARLPGLRLRGLMAIPEPVDAANLALDEAAAHAHQRAPFRALRELLRDVQGHLRDEPADDAGAARPDGGLHLDTLSMGMSADLEAAIAEGATIVRVGTAIFGSRPAGAGAAAAAPGERAAGRGEAQAEGTEPGAVRRA